MLADHLAHIADAARALRLGIAGPEHFGRTRSPGLDGGADFALTDAVTVADVEGRLSQTTFTLLAYANAVANHLQVAKRQCAPDKQR